MENRHSNLLDPLGSSRFLDDNLYIRRIWIPACAGMTTIFTYRVAQPRIRGGAMSALAMSGTMSSDWHAVLVELRTGYRL